MWMFSGKALLSSVVGIEVVIQVVTGDDAG